MSDTHKPKILFVAPLPPPYAGPETSAKLFLESAVSKTFEITSLNTNFRTSNSQKGKFDWHMVLVFFKLNWRLIRKLTSNRPHIVYYYVTATMLGWIGKDIWVILISKLLGAKVVIHMRAGHFRRNYEQSNKVFKTIIKWVLNRTDYNLAQSPSLAKQYRGLVKDESKIDYVYNMIDSEKYFSNNSEYNQNKIFFLGHLSHAKGYCDILKVIPEVVREFPDTMFCFAGTMIVEERNVFFNEVDGTAINYTNPNMVYKNHIENKYDRNYMYLGKLNEKEKIEWLNKSNIFILPSYSEGFSMSVLEAIAMAKPIITTPVGALKDVLIPNENAVLVHPGDIEAIKDAILKILRDKSFRKQLADNNKILRKDFTVEVNSQKYKNLFKKLI